VSAQTGSIEENHQLILVALSDSAGTTTGDVAKDIFPEAYRHDPKVTSARVRAMLGRMRKAGHVAHFDQNTPVCWVRTKDGTNSMQAHADEFELQPADGTDLE
jgi:hypothetical protein